jgi:hypothetical protein
MRIHGVTPDFINEIRQSGYDRLTVDKLVEFRIHGVSAKFIKDLKDAGYTDLSADDLVEIRINGREGFIRKSKRSQ